MSTRNERKRAAKARKLELLAAVEQAFAIEQAKKREFNDARDRYCSRVSDALRHHKEPRVRFGSIVGGKFVAASGLKEPPKRKLVLNPISGKLIERKQSAI